MLKVTKDGARPWVGAKRPPVGRVGRCPAYRPDGTYRGYVK